MIMQKVIPLGDNILSLIVLITSLTKQHNRQTPIKITGADIEKYFHIQAFKQPTFYIMFGITLVIVLLSTYTKLSV